MRKSQSNRVQELCAQIASEQDRDKFLKLVQELNQLLSANDGRLKDDELIDRKNDNRKNH